MHDLNNSVNVNRSLHLIMDKTKRIIKKKEEEETKKKENKEKKRNERKKREAFLCTRQSRRGV